MESKDIFTLGFKNITVIICCSINVALYINNLYHKISVKYSRFHDVDRSTSCLMVQPLLSSWILQF